MFHRMSNGAGPCRRRYVISVVEGFVKHGTCSLRIGMSGDRDCARSTHLSLSKGRWQGPRCPERGEKSLKVSAAVSLAHLSTSPPARMLSHPSITNVPRYCFRGSVQVVKAHGNCFPNACCGAPEVSRQSPLQFADVASLKRSPP